MTVGIKHAKTAPADDGSAQVNAAEWNSDHVIPNPLSPPVDGAFLGETGLQWDGSKLINVPSNHDMPATWTSGNYSAKIDKDAVNDYVMYELRRKRISTPPNEDALQILLWGDDWAELSFFKDGDYYFGLGLEPATVDGGTIKYARIWSGIFNVASGTPDSPVVGDLCIAPTEHLVVYDGEVWRSFAFGTIDANAHVSRHKSGGADALVAGDIDTLAGFTLASHQARHIPAGADALPWGTGGGLDCDKLDGSHLTDIPIDIVDKLKTGRWFLSLLSVQRTSTSQFFPGALRVQVVPFPVHRTMTFTQIGVYLTGNSGVVRLGLYNDTGDIYPNVLLETSGDIDGSVAGAISYTFPSPRQLTKGLYWLAIQTSINGSVPCVYLDWARLCGFATPPTVGISGDGSYYVDFSPTVMGLPNPFNSGAALGNGVGPALCLYLSSIP